MRFLVNLSGITQAKLVHADSAKQAAWTWAYEAPDEIWKSVPDVLIEVRSELGPPLTTFRVAPLRQFTVEQCPDFVPERKLT